MNEELKKFKVCWQADKKGNVCVFVKYEASANQTLIIGGSYASCGTINIGKELQKTLKVVNK